ncbi:MAG: hypothetical protein LC749_08345, partial [Actinobacteria bacterium]|nr:hypothetical protein [Actinomycetota bacterium]
GWCVRHGERHVPVLLARLRGNPPGPHTSSITDSELFPMIGALMRSPRLAFASAGVGVALALGTLLAAPASATSLTAQTCAAATGNYNIALGADTTARQNLARDERLDRQSEASDPKGTPGVPGTPPTPGSAPGVTPVVLPTSGTPAVPAVPAPNDERDAADTLVAQDLVIINDPNSGTAAKLARATKARDTACATTPVPNPTVGGVYPIPQTPVERTHLIQICIDNNQNLLGVGGISLGVLTQDCRDKVPPCPPKPCPCPTPSPSPEPTPVVVPPAQPPVVINQPPANPGPSVVVIAPPAPASPGTDQIGQAPSGFVQTGAINQADVYTGQ